MLGDSRSREPREGSQQESGEAEIPATAWRRMA